MQKLKYLRCKPKPSLSEPLSMFRSLKSFINVELMNYKACKVGKQNCFKIWKVIKEFSGLKGMIFTLSKFSPARLEKN